MAGLAGVIARLLLRRPDLLGLAVPLWRWLNVAVRRLERAVAQPVRARVRAQIAAKQVAWARAAPAVRLPSRRAWLVRELGWEVAGFGSQLQHLLGQAEMQAVLAERPAVGRVLRPICRMLGVEVAGLAPVKVVAAEVKAPRVPVVRTRVVRVKPAPAWRPGPIRAFWVAGGIKPG